MSRQRFLCGLFVIAIALLLACDECHASAFVKGAYYRLGDEDPGAAAGAIGADPTRDSFVDALHLGRSGSPHYAADVPALGPVGNKLSMAFANGGLGGPAVPGFYGRDAALPVVPQGIALEAWVKASGSAVDASQHSMIAYNGDPAANGFGLFLSGNSYVAHVGPNAEQVLGPANAGNWHHLAYVYSLGTSSYYYDGKLVGTSTTDAAPLPTSDGFWLAGRPPPGNAGGATQFPFNGWIDEVRYQNFNPIAAGAFEPTAFLIVPEPTGFFTCALACSAALLLRRRFSPPLMVANACRAS